MPIAPVDENGTVLYYDDTGPPNNPQYTTMVLIHGMIFHSAIFRRMIPYATHANLRLVLLNMRDYPGSSQYTSDEVCALRGPDLEDQRTAVKNSGLQLARFLDHFIRTNDIPPKSESSETGTQGGLVVLSWSLGNIVAHSFLAHAHELCPDLSTLLEKYLRTVVLHAVAALGIGQIPPQSPNPSENPQRVPTQEPQNALRDPKSSHLERLKMFATWVGSYYPPVNDLSSITPENANSRKPTHLSEIPLHIEKTRPSFESIAQEELKSVTDFDAFERSSVLLARIHPSIYLENFQRAHWFDNSTPAEERVWPKLKILVLWGDMDLSDCIWAASRFAFRLRVQSHPPKGQGHRDIEIVKVAGGNHLVHWDEPERFLRILLEKI